jgi:hypothetical protein
MSAESGHHEDTRSDDCAHAKSRQLYDSECALQTVFARFVRFLKKLLQRFAS